MTALAGANGGNPVFASGDKAGATGAEERPAPAASAFPDSDDSLSRTLVYDHPRMDKFDQVLVTLWATGEVDVATRPGAGATWGPPWILKEVESWS